MKILSIEVIPPTFAEMMRRAPGVEPARIKFRAHQRPGFLNAANACKISHHVAAEVSGVASLVPSFVKRDVQQSHQTTLKSTGFRDTSSDA